jgi:hydroxymethylbilane synthase
MVLDLLERRLEVEAELKIIRTQGDIVTDRPLRELEGSGYFTKEIEEALLDESIDVAVHSFKDMPSKSPAGLCVAAITVREDAADLLIIAKDAYEEGAEGFPLFMKAKVGTSAVRRETQLRAIRADLEIRDLRGNVPTRLKKLEQGDYDAILLASAGVRRLSIDLSKFQVLRLDPKEFIPAPGQGALAIQMREGDPRLVGVRAVLNHDRTAEATRFERAIQAIFGGGCGLPLGAHAYHSDGEWHLSGFWGGGERPKWESVTDDDPFSAADLLHQALTRV